MKQDLASRVLPKRLSDELDRYLMSHEHQRANPTKGVTSTATRKERRLHLRLAFAQLWQMGYRMKSVTNLRVRHVEALVRRWSEEGLAAGSLHNRISHLSTFAGWIGKAGMVRRPVDYLDKERVGRTYIAKEDLSWEGRGLDVAETIQRAKELDERFALYLTLQRAFGLRVKESIEFRPHLAIAADGCTIEVFEGTKGGKRRSVRIRDEEQRKALQWALEVARNSKGERLRWPDRTYLQATRRFYYLMERMGITKKETGTSAHGLRRGFAIGGYVAETGLPTPVQGGALGQIDRATHQRAAQRTSLDLGHARIPISGAYYGSYGHALRDTQGTPLHQLHTFSVSQLTRAT